MVRVLTIKEPLIGLIGMFDRFSRQKELELDIRKRILRVTELIGNVLEEEGYIDYARKIKSIGATVSRNKFIIKDQIATLKEILKEIE